jgi:hypothetical protein
MGKSKGPETVSGRLRRAVRESGQTLYRVAKGADLSYAALHRFATSRTGLALDSVDRLCAYLGLRLVQEE